MQIRMKYLKDELELSPNMQLKVLIPCWHTRGCAALANPPKKGVLAVIDIG